MDDFEQHLSDLFEVYGIDMATVPAADVLLSGAGLFDVSSSNLDQRYQLGKSMVALLTALWNKYGKKSNILIETKLHRFFVFLNLIEPELQIVLVRDLLDQGINLTEFEGFRQLVEEFGEFLAK